MTYRINFDVIPVHLSVYDMVLLSSLIILLFFILLLFEKLINYN